MYFNADCKKHRLNLLTQYANDSVVETRYTRVALNLRLRL